MTGVAGAAQVAMIKASGSLVRVDEHTFQDLVNRSEDVLVVWSRTKVFKEKFRYLTNVKGLTFHAQASRRLNFSGGVELIEAKSISIPP